jgi:hypothetical protein
VELTVTGTPAEVSPLIAQANTCGYPVDVQPIGGGLLRVAVGDTGGLARPARGHAPQPRPATAPDVADRQLLPRVLWIAGGTGAVALVGGTITLLIIDPVMLAFVAVLAVLALIAIGKSVTSVKSAFKGD